MRYRMIIPARVNLLGNPADANEGAHATISAAIDTHAGASIEPADEWVLEETTRDGQPIARDDVRGRPPFRYGSALDLVKAAVNRLYAYSSEFRERWTEHSGVRIAVWSGVPRYSGLGGSSMPALLTLAGLRALYKLDPHVHNNYVLAEVCQRAESQELGITCGFADRYVPLFGGLAYVDYRGKLFHRPVGEEPFATYERLDACARDLPLVVAYTGIARDSGDVHGLMRPRYLAEYEGWQAGGPKPFLVEVMERAGDTAWRGKMALLRHDWTEFGQLMAENHSLVDRMMTYCGLPDGAGDANNALIEAALAAGAYGAKLTGAGGRGSVFALTRYGEEHVVMDALREAAARAGLPNAVVWRAHVDCLGLRVEADQPVVGAEGLA